MTNTILQRIHQRFDESGKYIVLSKEDLIEVLTEVGKEWADWVKGQDSVPWDEAVDEFRDEQLARFKELMKEIRK